MASNCDPMKPTYFCKMCGHHHFSGTICDNRARFIKNLDKEDPYEEDVVNNPSHYKIRGTNVEALDVIRGSLTREEFIGYLRGNILKYHIRARSKGKEESMKKAHYYSKVLEEVLDEEV